MKTYKFTFRIFGNKMLKFYKREDGATAIEFAILALPFFTLLFGIMELAVVFFVQSNVQNATFEISRRIRTGEFSGTENQMKNAICREMTPGISGQELTDCREKLEVKVRMMGDFSKATAFAPPPPASSGPPPPNVQTTVGGDTVLVEVLYEHTLALPGKLTRLSNSSKTKQSSTQLNKDGSRKTLNIREIKIVTAFRNEPF